MGFVMHRLNTRYVSMHSMLQCHLMQQNFSTNGSTNANGTCGDLQDISEGMKVRSAQDTARHERASECECECTDCRRVHVHSQVNARVVAVLGSWLSETSIVMAGLLKAIKTVQVCDLVSVLVRPAPTHCTVLYTGAQVSHLASASELSTKPKYEYFLRTCPTDAFTAFAIARILRYARTHSSCTYRTGHLNGVFPQRLPMELHHRHLRHEQLRCACVRASMWCDVMQSDVMLCATRRAGTQGYNEFTVHIANFHVCREHIIQLHAPSLTLDATHADDDSQGGDLDDERSKLRLEYESKMKRLLKSVPKSLGACHCQPQPQPQATLCSLHCQCSTCSPRLVQ